ncbi:hypothetical protein ECDEC14D_2428 [Escherichia coli DEC14D]|nr:hypothetical protein ECDEC5C_0429 [Escherichia coli DEC5C]EHX91257.1 hypothetical protein ECDEC14D_2428 [Escherichia coli DEC14D]
MGKPLPDLGTFQKKMLHRYISASPLVVWLRAMEQAHQRAVQSLPPNQRFHAALTM